MRRLPSPRSIGFITSGLRAGGAEVMLHRLLSHVPPDEFRPFVVSLTSPAALSTRITELGIPVFHRSASGGGDGWRRLLAFVRDQKPDILQGWMYHGNVVAGFLGAYLSRQLPTLQHITHTLGPREKLRFSTRCAVYGGKLLSYRSRAVIYCAESSRHNHEQLGYSPRPSMVIPNGTDTSLFVPRIGAAATLRALLEIPPRAFLVGCVGRLHRDKGQDILLAAAPRILSTLEDLHLLFVGDGLDQQWLQKQGSADLSPEHCSRIHCLGYREDIPALLPQLDLLVSPSRSEAFPLIIGEAMACEVPCVATNVGDSSTLLGNSGTIVPPEDAEVLAEAIISHAQSPLTTRLEMGKAARRRIEQRFALHHSISQYVNTYQAVLDSCSRTARH